VIRRSIYLAEPICYLWILLTVYSGGGDVNDVSNPSKKAVKSSSSCVVVKFNSSRSLLSLTDISDEVTAIGCGGGGNMAVLAVMGVP
jgi:hypothetical protein